MKDQREYFLALFEEVDCYESCPCGVDLLVWDGASFGIEHVDMDTDTGNFYPANGFDFIAYIELPDQSISEALLGDGE